MAKCGYCGTTIFMGGVKAGDQRFCNKKCHQSSIILSAAKQIPPDVLRDQITKTHQGTCPKCGGRGPVDIHKEYYVWSALVMTRWSSKSSVSCRSCGIRNQVGAAIFSGVLGWWGFPWGLIMTPVQVGRNVMGICSGPDPARPSADLERFVKVNLGARLLASAQSTPSTNQPPAPPVVGSRKPPPPPAIRS